MNVLTDAQRQKIAEHLYVSCLTWQTPDLWETLSDREKVLVGHAKRVAAAELECLGEARRVRALELSAVLADALGE